MTKKINPQTITAQEYIDLPEELKEALIWYMPQETIDEVGRITHEKLVQGVIPAFVAQGQSDTEARASAEMMIDEFDRRLKIGMDEMFFAGVDMELLEGGDPNNVD